MSPPDNDTPALCILHSEFCEQPNFSLPMKPADVPSASSVDYLLEPAPKPEEEEEEEEKVDNDAASKKRPGRSNKSNLVIFVVDVSGSMATTSEVPALQGIINIGIS